MHTTAKITVFVALCFGLATALIPRKEVSRDAELSLMRFITQSRDVSDNPQRSMDCFGYYIPLLSECTDNYEKSYKACCLSADEARSTVDDETQSDREALQASANSTCAALSKCNDYESSLDYFTCYKTGGDSSMKTMFAISANASDILSDVEESNRLISGELDRCTNASERTYIEEYSNTFGELQGCTKGETQVPMATTTTSTTTIIDSTITESEITTDEPITTTLEPERSFDENALPEEDHYNLDYHHLALTFQKLRKHF